ncbi:putative hipA domain protein [Burkholderia pseudomallei MSHR640]|nr:putative hipA domain protein [Burkholderia pseudomallei MSHR640]
MLKFFAWPSVAASSQNTICAAKNARRSSRACSEPASTSMIVSMPGPPSA